MAASRSSSRARSITKEGRQACPEMRLELKKKKRQSEEVPAAGYHFHRESVSGWGGFSLGVLIASCTANSKFILEFSETLRVATAPAPRSSQVVQNLC